MKRSDFVAITEEHIIKAKKIINNEGCTGLICRTCPFFRLNATNLKDCYANGYREYNKSKLVISSARLFIGLFSKNIEEKGKYYLDQ